MPPPDEVAGGDLKKLLEVWVATDLKAQVVVFYHNNPGVIETMEGLARRIGTSVETLQGEIADHIQLGLLRERKVGTKTVLVYNQSARNHIEEFIHKAIKKRMEEST